MLTGWARFQSREVKSYTPKHLAEKILSSAEAELVGGGEAEEKDVLLEVLGARAVVLPLVAVGRFHRQPPEQRVADAEGSQKGEKIDARGSRPLVRGRGAPCW